jgi:hypothetical protein
MSILSVRQPVLGCVATVLCIVLALVICGLFDPLTFGTWVTLILVAMVPAQIILALVWKNSFPAFAAGFPQPFKGIALLACMASAGLLVVPLSLFLVGGGITPPNPYVLQFIIFTVIVTFWLVIVMQCWPMSAFSSHPLAIGGGTWVIAYLTAYILFRQFFNFGFLADTPLHVPALDPQGLFPGWMSLSYAFTTLMIMMALVLLDFWPVSSLGRLRPALSQQPVFGLIATMLVLLLAWCIWYFFVSVQAMDPVVYMVRVPVSVVFGEFIVLVMLQTAPVQLVGQPTKGLVLIGLALLLGIGMYALYSFAAELLIGEMSAGAPQYQLDLWLASAMLAVTFPLFVTYAEFFGYWPFRGEAQESDGS